MIHPFLHSLTLFQCVHLSYPPSIHFVIRPFSQFTKKSCFPTDILCQFSCICHSVHVKMPRSAVCFYGSTLVGHLPPGAFFSNRITDVMHEPSKSQEKYHSFNPLCDVLFFFILDFEVTTTSVLSVIFYD